MNPAKSYRASEVAAADGIRLVIMTYDGTIGFLMRSRAALEEGRWNDGAAHALRAKRVLVHLVSSLDLSAGDVAMNLQRLYGYCLDRIAAALQERSTERLDEAITVLRDLRAAWSKAEGEPTRADKRAPADLSVSA